MQPGDGIAPQRKKHFYKSTSLLDEYGVLARNDEVLAWWPSTLRTAVLPGQWASICLGSWISGVVGRRNAQGVTTDCAAGSLLLLLTFLMHQLGQSRSCWQSL